MKFAYIWYRFESCLKKSACPKRKIDVKPHSAFFTDGTAHSHVGVGIVSTDYPPPSHLTVPPSPSDVEDHVCTPVQPSHPPNITPFNFHTYLVVIPSSSHMDSFFDLCLHTQGFLQMMMSCVCPFHSSLVVNEEQPIDGVGVAQPTCVIIH